MNSWNDTERFWFKTFFFLFCLRTIQILSLYFAPMPMGGKLVDDWTRFLPHTLVVEIGLLAFLILIPAILELPIKNEKFIRGFRKLSIIVFMIYLILCQIDSELMRWLGQHFNWVWMKTYVSSPDSTMLAKILTGNFVWTCLNWLSVVIGIFVLSSLYRKSPSKGRIHRNVFALLVVLAIAGLTSKDWFGPSKMRWRRIQPVVWSLTEDVIDGLVAPNKNLDEKYLRQLQKSLNLSTSSDLAAPFWKENPAERDSLKAFIDKPFDQKPDLILIVIESARGWSFDLRDTTVQKDLPHLTKLWQERGAFFPYCFASGFPSVEGFLGVNLGIPSHPDGIFLTDNASVRTRALPQILQSAGYHTQILTGTEPSFDNLYPWFNKWFNSYEYNPDVTDDLPLAKRFIELQKRPAQEVPLYSVLNTSTTHLPFNVPEGEGDNSADSPTKYQNAIKYLDKSIEYIVEGLKKNPRWNQTYMIFVGDHSITNEWQNSHSDDIGYPNYGHTWIPLLVVGPQIGPAKLETKSVALIDIPSTFMAISRVKASNHFMGVNVLDSILPNRQIPAWRLKGGAIQIEKTRYQYHLRDDDMAMRFDLINPNDSNSTKNDPKYFEHGYPLSLQKEERTIIQDWKQMSLAYKWIIDNDHLIPRNLRY